MTLRDKMLAVIADTNDSVAEREELVEMIAISLLTRKKTCLFWVSRDRPRAMPSTCSAGTSPVRGSLSGFFPSRAMKNSFSAVLILRVCCRALCRKLCWSRTQPIKNQRFNLRVLVEGIGSMKDEPATWGKAQERHRKLELYRAALSALHKKRAHGADSRQNSRGRYRIVG